MTFMKSWMTLPKFAPRALTALPTDDVGSRKRVFIADDDKGGAPPPWPPSLESEGYDVDEAEDGCQAVAPRHRASSGFGATGPEYAQRGTAGPRSEISTMSVRCC